MSVKSSHNEDDDHPGRTSSTNAEDEEFVHSESQIREVQILYHVTLLAKVSSDMKLAKFFPLKSYRSVKTYGREGGAGGQLKLSLRRVFW